MFIYVYIYHTFYSTQLTLLVEISSNTAKLVKWEVLQWTRSELFTDIVSIPVVDHFPLPILYWPAEQDDVIQKDLQIFQLCLNNWCNIPQQLTTTTINWEIFMSTKFRICNFRSQIFSDTCGPSKHLTTTTYYY